MQKSREGYDKNWTHFVYKLDNLFRSIRVRTKTHLLQRPALQFSRLFCGQYAPYKATSSTFNPFWHHLLFFMHLLICFELNDPKIKKHYKWTLKMLKLGIVSSFHPHSMCVKSREGHGKNSTHFVYKLDNLFRSIRVSDENSSITKAGTSFSQTYYSSWLFCVPYAPLKAMS